MAQGPGTVDPSALAPWISTGLARDALAAGHAGQGEVRGPLARLEAAAAGAAGRGRLQLLQPPAQQAQRPQGAQEQEAQQEDQQPQGDIRDQPPGTHRQDLHRRNGVIPAGSREFGHQQIM